MQSKSWNKYFHAFILYVSAPVIYSCPLVFQYSHVSTTLEEEWYHKKAEKFQKTKFRNNNDLDLQALELHRLKKEGKVHSPKTWGIPGWWRTVFSDPGRYVFSSLGEGKGCLVSLSWHHHVWKKECYVLPPAVGNENYYLYRGLEVQKKIGCCIAECHRYLETALTNFFAQHKENLG